MFLMISSNTYTPAETRLKFNCITENETIKAINRLENKSSSGHDGISNKLLKLIKNELKTPLTLKCCIGCGVRCIPHSGSGTRVVPGWKDHVKHDKDQSLFWHWI